MNALTLTTQFGYAPHATMLMQTKKPLVPLRGCCLMHNVVWCFSFHCLPCWYPPSTLTMYVSKVINKNICMLVENYRAMRKRSETKVKKELTHQERTWHHWNHGVSRSLVFQSIGLEESQYQTWSYLVETDRSTQWLPMLNGTTNISLSL
jgi:hypothetical protein